MRSLKNLLSIESMSAETILSIVTQALEIKAHGAEVFTGQRTVANLFYENSTRTRLSFEIAQRRLGLDVINFEADRSSVQKGESLYDTCRTLESLGVSALVIRHPENSYYEQLAGVGISIINGGDGSGEHPTQSLLDMATIYEEFGSVAGLRVLIAGDIKNSRVARSNALALKKLGAQVFFSAPAQWQTQIADTPYVDLDDAVNNIDVCMLLRVQSERHAGEQPFNRADYHARFGLTRERYERLAGGAIVMHPAPVNRGVEIDSALVESPRSRIFKQMQNGVYVRMACLQRVLCAGQKSEV